MRWVPKHGCSTGKRQRKWPNPNSLIALLKKMQISDWPPQQYATLRGLLHCPFIDASFAELGERLIGRFFFFESLFQKWDCVS